MSSGLKKATPDGCENSFSKCNRGRGGQWNFGGNCDGETRPIMNNAHLSPYPWMMRALETEISRIKMLVFYLNITKMTDYRKKGTLRYSDNRLRRGKMSRFSKTAVIGASLECPIPVLVNSDQKNIIKHAICVLIH